MTIHDADNAIPTEFAVVSDQRALLIITAKKLIEQIRKADLADLPGNDADGRRRSDELRLALEGFVRDLLLLQMAQKQTAAKAPAREPGKVTRPLVKLARSSTPL